LNAFKTDPMVTLEEITSIRAPMERCFDLARSVEVHLTGNVHYREKAVAEAGVISGLLGAGDRVTWRARHFWISWRLTSEITTFDRPAYSQDVMLRGPFRLMRHDHFFRPAPGGGTDMRDVFCFAAPIPILGRMAEILFLRSYMRRLLHERNAVIKEIAESESL
jgi:ligand-binding SRPBCC domain-containing protein